jgi:hypothetical protein
MASEWPRGNWQQPPEQRLRDRTDKSGECWIWRGGTGRGGYGKITVAGRTQATHRLAWEIEHGPIPDGMNVLHRCDNPPCVRPEHLFLGTIAENNAYRARKGRSSSGDKHHNRRRSPLYGKGDEIRWAAKLGMTHERIAAHYGVSRSAISLVLEGKRQ